jgi:phosphoribosylanthranilate isomerase
VRPYGVDVNSGVETRPGRKDHDKVWRFVGEARRPG